MKKTISLLLTFAAITAVSGCAVSVESLLTPPKLDEEQSAIYNALRLSKGGDVHLKYPVSGQYRSAFVIKDIDDEPTDEAIVFYEASNVTDGGSSLRLNFLDMQDGQWVSVYDFAALGNEIQRVRFSDLGNSKTSVIVTYAVQNSSDMATSIFKYEDNTPTEVYKNRHAYMQLMDINEDGTDEVFLININRTESVANAYLLGWNESGFSELSAVPINGDFTECRNIVSGIAEETGKNGLFINYSLPDGSLGTEALICDGRSFHPSSPAVSQFSHHVNTYTPAIYANDIDNDGVIEFSATSPFPGYEGLTYPEQVNMTSWYQLSENGTKVNQEYFSYVSVRKDYVLFMPPRWMGLVTAKVSIADGTATFSRYLPTTGQTGEELLVIRAVAAGNLGKTDLTGFSPIGKNEKTDYCFYIKNNTANSFALTEAEISDYFMILE